MRPHDHSDRLARGELADPAIVERQEAADPEGVMRRRDFLARTAAVAGSAGLASMLPAEQLVAEAAKRTRGYLPSPRNVPIDTFVVLMMENRSFDHYFGWHPRADGRNRGLSYPDADGHKVKTHHLGGEYQGCAFRDPDHSWEGGRHQWGRGRMNGFVQGNKEGTGSDEFAAGYYLKADLPFIPHVASRYTLYDRWFCSTMNSTYPNRHYQWSAQCGGTKTNSIPADTLGYDWETIFDRAIGRGLTARYYASDIPFSALYGSRALPWSTNLERFYVDCQAGTLPNIAFVDPGFAQASAGTSTDEHPFGDVRLGQAFMSDVVHAFVESPHYRRGALFIDYDEWGGFFDHVQPHFVPDDRRSRKLFDDFGMTGFRIPGVAVSPWTRGGRISHQLTTHESILKLISYRFKLGHLNQRHRYASNIGRTFKWHKPDYELPEMPDPASIVATPCALQGKTAADIARPHEHDLKSLQTSGYLDRLGFKVPDASPDKIFRLPDMVMKAFEESNRRSAGRG